MTASFLLAFVAVLMLSLQLPLTMLLVIVAFAGLGSVGTQSWWAATVPPTTRSP